MSEYRKSLEKQKQTTMAKIYLRVTARRGKEQDVAEISRRRGGCVRRDQGRQGSLSLDDFCAISPYLPLSPRIPLYLPVSPRIFLPVSARICPYPAASPVWWISYLPVSPGLSQYPAVSRGIPRYPAISRREYREKNRPDPGIRDPTREGQRGRRSTASASPLSGGRPRLVADHPHKETCTKTA